MDTGSSISHARDGSSPEQNYGLGLADEPQNAQDRDDNDDAADASFAQPRQGYEFPPLQRLRVDSLHLSE